MYGRLLTIICLTSLASCAHLRIDRSVKSDSSDARSPPTIWSNVDWYRLGKERISKAMSRGSTLKNHKAKNIILFLGDGMGFSTIASTRAYKAHQGKLKLEDSYLVMETLPFSGISRTYSVDRTTADSASTSTAYLSGVKANMGTIGVNEFVSYGDCSNMTRGNRVTSIAKQFMKEGRPAGIVTTSRVTHASPAGSYAHSPDRNWESYVPPPCSELDDIAHQLVHGEDNQNIRVVMGGGSGKFVSSDEKIHDEVGERTDGMNLIKNWEGKRINDTEKYSVVLNKTDFDRVDPLAVNYLLGLFSFSHMSFEAKRNKTLEPSLADMTEKAIKILNKNCEGYFLFVEGARIDHAHHDNMARLAIEDTLAFDEAIERALNVTDNNDTLIVVTSDHSHVNTLGGYGLHTESVLGFADDGNVAKDGKPFLQIQYANGPGYSFHRMEDGIPVPRKNLSEYNVTDLDFVQDAGIWRDSETHGGEDVPIFASGPMSHLLGSVEEQTFVAHLMMSAACLGQYVDGPHCFSHSVSISTLSPLCFVLSLLFYAFARGFYAN